MLEHENKTLSLQLCRAHISSFTKKFSLLRIIQTTSRLLTKKHSKKFHKTWSRFSRRILNPLPSQQVVSFQKGFLFSNNSCIGLHRGAELCNSQLLAASKASYSAIFPVSPFNLHCQRLRLCNCRTQIESELGLETPEMEVEADHDKTPFALALSFRLWSNWSFGD